MTKEAYLHDKRDLLTRQKRPINMTKDTYVHAKRGLLQLAYPKRPM